MREPKAYDKKIFTDERGYVAHFLRNDEKPFHEFGEVYFSCVYPGIIKGWHRHKIMELNYICVYGNIQLVCYDEDTENFYEFFIGERNYKMVNIPAGLWNAFRAVGGERAIVANCSTTTHDPEEIQRVNHSEFSILYDWNGHI